MRPAVQASGMRIGLFLASRIIAGIVVPLAAEVYETYPELQLECDAISDLEVL